MLRPCKNTDLFCLVIYLKESEPGLRSVVANLRIIWEKMVIWKRSAWDGNLFCTIFFIYAGIWDNAPWEDTCSKQPFKTLSKCQNKHCNIKRQYNIYSIITKWTIWQILLLLIVHMFIGRKYQHSIKLYHKESANAGVL